MVTPPSPFREQWPRGSDSAPFHDLITAPMLVEQCMVWMGRRAGLVRSALLPRCGDSPRSCADIPDLWAGGYSPMRWPQIFTPPPTVFFW